MRERRDRALETAAHTPRDLPSSACTGKTDYLTWNAANSALKAHRGRFKAKAGRGPLTPYRCRFCGFWHLGHK